MLAGSFDWADPHPLSGGGSKSANAGQGYFESMTQAKKDYLKELFYKKLKASVGQRGLYEHMLVDKAKIDDHPS